VGGIDLVMSCEFEVYFQGCAWEYVSSRV
jgi:hypothetical protein